MSIPAAAAAAVRDLYNNHFSGTLPASLASSTSLMSLYVPYSDLIDNIPIARNVQIMVQTQSRIIVVGGCRVEGCFNDSTKDEDLMCMNRTVMMCDFAISRHCNKHTTNIPLKRRSSCFHQTVTIAATAAAAAAALRMLYNNHFSGTLPASLASSTSLYALYVP